MKAAGSASLAGSSTYTSLTVVPSVLTETLSCVIPPLVVTTFVLYSPGFNVQVYVSPDTVALYSRPLTIFTSESSVTVPSGVPVILPSTVTSGTS